jgi:two-component system, chemotaxis family, protein-glutamate methylesterase/glutaminase
MAFPKYVFAVGASAGGLPAVSRAVAGLDRVIDMAVLVVIHLSRQSNAQNIVNAIQKNTGLDCLVADDGMAIQSGCLYLAPADKHLAVKNGLLQLNQGPHENKYRPAIDALFRAVAVNYANRAVGIILTGMLDDGTSGMWAIQSCGGTCIAQDPDDAEFPDMPRSVINKVKIDHIVTLREMPDLITKIAQSPLPTEKPIPKELAIEAEITERMMSEIDELKQIGDRSDFVCPDCGGGLYEIKNDPAHRYRCHTGHTYTERLLGELKDEKIEESLWVSIRMLEEKHNLLRLMGQRNELGSGHLQRVKETGVHVARLKKLLLSLSEK